MNFLQLCQKLARDSGTVAGVPSFTTVVGAEGRVAQVVGWIQDAYTDIQNERNDWLWMRKSFSHALTIGQKVYDFEDDFALTDVKQLIPDRADWRNLSLYDPATGQSDEGEIASIPYDVWRERYARRTHDQNRPTEWAMSPQGELVIGATPDKAYILSGEYRAKRQELTADADVPDMPEEYHNVIIAEAIRIMALADEAFQVLNAQALQYARLRSALVRDQTGRLAFGGGTFA